MTSQVSNNIISDVTAIPNEILSKMMTINNQLQFGSSLKTVMGTATSFLIAFAWRDAIRELIDKVIEETHVDDHTVWHKYPQTMYALFVTIIGIVALYALGENKFNVTA